MPTRPILSGLHPISSPKKTALCRPTPSPSLPLPSHNGRPDQFMIPLTIAMVRGIMTLGLPALVPGPGTDHAHKTSAQ